MNSNEFYASSTDDDRSTASSAIDSDKSHTGYEGEDEGEQETEKVEIAKAENKAVGWIRMLVILVLVASSLGVALTVYFYTRNAEISEFEDEFLDASTKIFESIGSTLDQVLGAVDAFNAVMITSAHMSNSTWPFFTMPDYAVHTAKLRSLSKAFYVGTFAVVQEEELEAWENYTQVNNGWVDDGLEIQSHDKNFKGTQLWDYYTSPTIFGISGDPVSYPGPYYVTWQSSPVVPKWAPYNLDMGAVPTVKNALEEVARSKRIVLDAAVNIPVDPDDPLHVRAAAGNVKWASGFIPPDQDPSEPFTNINYPIIDSAVDGVSTLEGDPETGIGAVVGYTAFSLFFREVISDILPPRSEGINVVFDNTCGTLFTYEINGPETNFLGSGDLHDTRYDDLGQESDFSKLDVFQLRDRTYSGLQLTEDYCPYSLRIYPSKATEEVYTSSNPITYTVVTILIFAFTSMVFLLYDALVERRQKKVMTTAVQSSAIVSSIYPSIVRDRLFGQNTNAEPKKKEGKDADAFKAGKDTPKLGLKSFLNGHGNATAATTDDHSGGGSHGAPIAEHFAETTIMFADLAGFTAWSSSREPVQVFTLLEALYGAFDAAARRRRVFKVETIGDCYMAVAGLPEPRKDHATVMAKFAKDCRDILNRKVQELKVDLGPDTAELKLRTGLHSGPVIAGVLRGEKARFQLFGDTVNTASRMESNGAKDKIHISQSTADALIAAGKEHWITPRETPIEAKGKGLLKTYWLTPKLGGAKSHDTATSTQSLCSDEFSGVPAEHHEVEDHLVHWFTGVLSKPLRRILQGRSDESTGDGSLTTDAGHFHQMKNEGTVLDEVKDVISLSHYGSAAMALQDESPIADIDAVVLHQLRDYVFKIGSLYKDHPYHNFEHASHVTASVAKLLSRIQAAANLESTDSEVSSSSEVARGIMFDPQLQFACLFAGLVHNVYHPGVSNAQLAAEDGALARLYKGKSIAEQKSVELSWDLFMLEEYKEFRQAVCGTEKELLRFRQLVVNCVMATDVVDQDLKAIRNARWERSFGSAPGNSVYAEEDTISRKATAVIENIMQASVYAPHFMHWDIFRKWNGMFFRECYQAHRDGRMKEDPSETWFLGEIGFFDNYVIPLAHKLKDCGVFGVSGADLLDFAVENRQQWEEQGREVLKEMLEEAKK